MLRKKFLFVFLLTPFAIFAQAFSDSATLKRMHKAGVSKVIHRYAKQCGWWSSDTMDCIYKIQHFDRLGRLVLDESIHKGKPLYSTSYEYNDEGLVSRIINANLESPHHSTTTTKKYDAAGNCVEQCSYTSGALTFRQVSVFNKAGQLISRFDHDADTGNRNRTTYIYRNGMLTREDYFYMNKPAGYKLFSYDSRGNRVKQEIHFNDGTSIMDYGYDSASRLLWSEGRAGAAGRMEYVYNNDGLMVESYMKSGAVVGRSVYSYNDKKLLVRKSDSVTSFTDPDQKSRTVYTYDEYGRVIRKETFSGEKFTYVFRTQYNDKGKVVEEFEDFHGSSKAITYRYDHNDSLERKTEIFTGYSSSGWGPFVRTDTQEYKFSYSRDTVFTYLVSDSETIAKLRMGYVSYGWEGEYFYKRPLRIFPVHPQILEDTLSVEIFKDSTVMVFKMAELVSGVARHYLKRRVTGAREAYHDYDTMGRLLFSAERKNDKWTGLVLFSMKVHTDTAELLYDYGTSYTGMLYEKVTARTGYSRKEVTFPTPAVTEYFYKEGKLVREEYRNNQGYRSLSICTYEHDGQRSVVEAYGMTGELNYKIYRTYRNGLLVEEYSVAHRGQPDLEYTYEYFK